MNAESLVTVSAVVVTLVQLLKWAFLPDRWGPVAVLFISALGVTAYAFSQIPPPWDRTLIWPMGAGWITVALSAAGTFGFTRAGASAVISAKPPPAGAAGSSPTV